MFLEIQLMMINIIIFSVRMSHVWQYYATHATESYHTRDRDREQTQRDNGVIEEGASHVTHVT